MSCRPLAIALVLAALPLAAHAEAGVERAAVPEEPAEAALSPVRGTPLLGGTHWRFDSPGGGVHVFRPKGYRHADAGVVVYLHGYYTDVDQAWALHRLPDQFADSGRNALFVAAESPVGNPDQVKWRDPQPLLELVEARTGVAIPSRPLIAVGHSGAFRTVVPWLTSPRLGQVVLLDGLYNNLPDFAAWISRSDGKPRRLILVGFETTERTMQMLSGLNGAVVRDSFPDAFADFTRRERTAPLLFIRSQYGHMELVTEGKVLPLCLRLTGLPPL